MAHALHQSIEALLVARAGGELNKPLPEGRIERTPLRAGNGSRLLQKIFVGTQRDIFHTKIVYTKFVQLSLPGRSGT